MQNIVSLCLIQVVSLFTVENLQGIATYLMANSAQQKVLSCSVWTCATQSPCVVSSGKSGGTWMCIGTHLFTSFEHPQKLIFSHRKGLDVQQTTFAMKKIQILPLRWSAKQNISFHEAVTHSWHSHIHNTTHRPLICTPCTIICPR